MQRVFVTVAVLIVLTGGAGLAHHAWTGEFDKNLPMIVQGTVKQMDWVNPHSWIYVEVKDDTGKVIEWAVEAAAPNALIRRGFTKHSLPAGTEIRVEGFRAKDGTSYRMSGSKLIYVKDGKSLFMGAAGVGAPVEPPK